MSPDRPPIPSFSSIKRKISVLEISDDEDDDFQGGTAQPFPSTSKSTIESLTPSPSHSSKKARKDSVEDRDDLPIFLDLAPLEIDNSTPVPKLQLHLGKHIFIDTVHFRNVNYLCISRRENGVIKNRFNIPLEMLGTLKKAINLLEENI